MSHSNVKKPGQSKSFIKQEDCSIRFNNTICFYDGEPVYVTVDTNFPVNTLHIEKLVNTTKVPLKKKIIHVEDEKFSYLLPPLGYININGDSYYVSRNPERNTQQGLSLAACMVNAHYMETHNFRSKSMYDMLMDIYPSFDECLAFLKGVVGGRAFSKDCALVRTGGMLWLEYQGDQVATYNEETKAFNMDLTNPRNSFLVQILSTEHGLRFN